MRLLRRLTLPAPAQLSFAATTVVARTLAGPRLPVTKSNGGTTPHRLGILWLGRPSPSRRSLGPSSSRLLPHRGGPGRLPVRRSPGDTMQAPRPPKPKDEGWWSDVGKLGFKQAEGLSSCGRCVPVAVSTAPRTPTLFVHRADLSGISKNEKVMVVDFSLENVDIHDRISAR